MFPAVGQNLKLGRGSLLIYPHSGTVAAAGAVPVGNAESIAFSWEIEEREKYSATQSSSPLLAQAKIRTKLSLLVQCDEHTEENMMRFFMATKAAANQGPTTGGVANFTSIEKGKIYDLGHRNVSSVVLMVGTNPLVLGEDYQLYAAAGFVQFLETSLTLNGGENVSASFVGAQVNLDHFRIGQNPEQFAKLVYVADDANTSGIAAGDRFVFHKTQVMPEGDYQAVSDDYVPFNLRFSVLPDPAFFADPLGRFERVAA